MHRMLHEVDWTTLIFFIGIFVIVGGLEATEVIAWIAGIIGNLAGDNLPLATALMVWIPGVASGIVANIPFTVAALPIADFLTATIPGAENMVLYWSLILGADLGGNATILGSAPNIVAVGLLGQAGYRLSFGRFMRDGVPVTDSHPITGNRVVAGQVLRRNNMGKILCATRGGEASIHRSRRRHCSGKGTRRRIGVSLCG